MIVVDASAAVLALVADGDARRMLSDEAIAVPHLADAEVVSALRAHVRRGEISDPAATAALTTWGGLGVIRLSGADVLWRVWELRENLSAYDATYVALAEAIGCELVTADGRLARAPGTGCPMVVVRS